MPTRKPMTSCCVSQERVHVNENRVDQAVAAIERAALEVGFAECLVVAEEFSLEFGVKFDGENGMQFELTDLQTIGYAAALRARAERVKDVGY